MSQPTADGLEPYGWDPEWAHHLAAHRDGVPGRVLRHDGVALTLATPAGVSVVALTRRLKPPPAVGDWVVCVGGEVVALLDRRSLLQRLDSNGEASQVLAANVELVLLVCGLDRPVKAGRLVREATLAWDAGAEPLVVLTKAATHERPEDVAEAVAAACPGLDVLLTSALEGVGLDDLRARLAGCTTTMIGESGAGKSTLLNAVVGSEAAATGRVRHGDAKGRHTTTSRELFLLPGGGSLIDMPGIRSVGLLVDVEAVAQTFADVTELAAECRFRNCVHAAEPGCAVSEAIEEGRLDGRRVDAWRQLMEEAEEAQAAVRGAHPHRTTGRSGSGPGSTRPASNRRGRR